MAGSTLTRADIDKLRGLLMHTRELFTTILEGGEVDRPRVMQTALELDQAIAMTDPARPRTTSDVGARVLEAAGDVGIDLHRLDMTVRTMVPLFPTGALSRILYHELKKTSYESLDRIADLIGCEREWLRYGKGEKRTKPIPPGVITARGLGASESAIQAVLERDARVDGRDEQAWCMAFLQETKREQDGEVGTSSDGSEPNVVDDAPSSIRLK